MKTARQLKDKAGNLSAKTGTPSYIIQRNYFLERFLERVSLSGYRDSIILKGGVLLASVFGIKARSTMDLDATLRSKQLSSSVITKIVDAVLQVSIDDGVAFSLADIEETRVEADYPGFRITLGVAMDKLRDTIKLDFTAGDIVTPKPIEYGYALMFEDREISVLAYNLETVLAEKFAAILSLDVINTRMKDFYDIHMIISEQREQINPQVFAEAVINTAKQRHMLHLLEKADRIIEAVAQSHDILKLWGRYQTEYAYAAGIQFSDIIDDLKTLAGWRELVRLPLLSHLNEYKDIAENSGKTMDEKKRSSTFERD